MNVGAHASNPSTWEVVEGESEVQGHAWLYQLSLWYKRDPVSEIKKQLVE